MKLKLWFNKIKKKKKKTNRENFSTLSIKYISHTFDIFFPKK